MNLRWLSNHWFIFAFLFAAGGVSAQQEWRISQMESEKLKIDKKMETLVRIDERQKQVIKIQSDVIKKLDLLIELQIKGTDRDR